MSSPEKIAANRANALKSTGPKSERGKAHSALNATSHGIYARALLLPFESATEHRDLLERVWADEKPVGPVEEELAYEIVTDLWQLKRLEHGESVQLRKKIQSRAKKRQPISKRVDGVSLATRLIEKIIAQREGRTLPIEPVAEPPPRPKIEPNEEDVAAVLAETAGDRQQVRTSLMVERQRKSTMRKILQTRIHFDEMRRKRATVAQADLQEAGPRIVNSDDEAFHRGCGRKIALSDLPGARENAQ